MKDFLLKIKNAVIDFLRDDSFKDNYLEIPDGMDVYINEDDRPELKKYQHSFLADFMEYKPLKILTILMILAFIFFMGYQFILTYDENEHTLLFPEKAETTEACTEELLININSASKFQLMMLDGIGEVKATAIIEYREANGNFLSVEDIKNVKGIGDATFENIKNNIII